jgi:hypothetical protein
VSRSVLNSYRPDNTPPGRTTPLATVDLLIPTIGKNRPCHTTIRLHTKGVDAAMDEVFKAR